MIIERRASVLVCDEMMYSLTGKVTLAGIYIQDIVIPGPALQMNQLVFFFTVETPKEEPFRSLTYKVQLPGSPPVLQPTPIIVHNIGATDPRRKKITFRQPLLIQQPVLLPGRIEASVIHENGEIDAGGIWIITAEEASAAAAAQIP